MTAFAPHFRTYLLHHTLDAVTTDIDAVIALPTATFDQVDQVDILMVPGAPNKHINRLLCDTRFLAQLRRLGSGAQYITSVCTGSLLLARAGLLDGFRATSHWSALEVLAAMGIETVKQRVVHDRNRITAGGVTAGIDFSLTLLEKLKGIDAAKLTQLMMEYDPAPPSTLARQKAPARSSPLLHANRPRKMSTKASALSQRPPRSRNSPSPKRGHNKTRK